MFLWGGRADVSLGTLDSDVVYTHDSWSVYTGQLTASSDTNEPCRPPFQPRLGAGVAGATWAMATREAAVDSSSGTLGYYSCAASTVGVGVS